VRRAGLYVEAAIALMAASVALRAAPRGRASRLLGRPRRGERGGGETGAGAGAGEVNPRARGVGRAVERVAAVLPWRPSCLPQAVATRAMLMRRGIACEAHLGIISTAPLEAHAWVTVAGHVVTGGRVKASEVAALG
jgi:hypothetical protein